MIAKDEKRIGAETFGKDDTMYRRKKKNDLGN